MFADLRDEKFPMQEGAIYVLGYYSEPFMGQMTGVAYSRAPFKMKAILADGVVWIPDPSYALKCAKHNRDYANYPMTVARIQPPERAIQEA